MNSRASGRPVEILLVDNGPEDLRLTQKALKEGTVRNNLSVVGDGEEAIAFLRHEAQYSDTVRPDIILLDLNLSMKDGYMALIVSSIKTARARKGSQ